MPTDGLPSRVLLIDDDPVVLSGLATLLRKAGHTVAEAERRQRGPRELPGRTRRHRLDRLHHAGPHRLGCGPHREGHQSPRARGVCDRGGARDCPAPAGSGGGDHRKTPWIKHSAQRDPSADRDIRGPVDRGADAGQRLRAPPPPRHASGAGRSGPVARRLSRQHAGTLRQGNQQRPADARQADNGGPGPTAARPPKREIGCAEPRTRLRGTRRGSGVVDLVTRRDSPPSGGSPMDRLVPYRSRVRSPPGEADRRSTAVLDQDEEGAEALANGEMLHWPCQVAARVTGVDGPIAGASCPARSPVVSASAPLRRDGRLSNASRHASGGEDVMGIPTTLGERPVPRRPTPRLWLALLAVLAAAGPAAPAERFPLPPWRRWSGARIGRATSKPAGRSGRGTGCSRGRPGPPYHAGSSREWKGHPG